MIDFQTAYPMPTRAAGVCISQQECGKNLAIEGCQGKGSASKYGQFDLVLTFKLAQADKKMRASLVRSLSTKYPLL